MLPLVPMLFSKIPPVMEIRPLVPQPSGTIPQDQIILPSEITLSYRPLLVDKMLPLDQTHERNSFREIKMSLSVMVQDLERRDHLHSLKIRSSDSQQVRVSPLVLITPCSDIKLEMI